jgi:uncharacterized protein (DUF1697 family)
METFVALLRAVNVSGVNRLPMPEFRDMLVGIGLKSPKTYLQSGNVVFKSDLSAPVLVDLIADAVLKSFGFRPPVFVLSHSQFQAALNANPFPKAVEDPTQLHGFFMDRALPDATMAFLKSVAAPGEEYAIRGRVLWLHLPHGLARSRLAQRVTALPIGITARNYRSIASIAEMAGKLAEKT